MQSMEKQTETVHLDFNLSFELRLYATMLNYKKKLNGFLTQYQIMSICHVSKSDQSRVYKLFEKLEDIGIIVSKKRFTDPRKEHYRIDFDRFSLALLQSSPLVFIEEESERFITVTPPKGMKKYPMHQLLLKSSSTSSSN